MNVSMNTKKGKYAERTKISTDSSIFEIKKMVEKYGATGFGWVEDPQKCIVSFAMQGRMVKVVLQPMPAVEQLKRQRYRALLLYIHAKLEAVEIGIMSFDQAFLSELMTEDGYSIGERIMPQITAGQFQLALPAPKAK